MNSPNAEPGHPRPTTWRTLWLLIGFAVVVGIGVATVLVPELKDERTKQSERSEAGRDLQGSERAPQD